MDKDRIDSLGVGALIHILTGNEDTVKAVRDAIGKEIAAVKLSVHPDDGYNYKGDEIVLTFTDGTGIKFWDDGQSCCEHRYMVCDDQKEFPSFIGAKFLKAEAVKTNNLAGEYDHEVMFLNITTSKGVIQCATHNVHNGYYGGFAITARTINKE